MSINYDTAQKVILQNGKCYYTNKGNVHKAIPLFDKKHRLHGHIILTITPDKNGGEPYFNIFVSKLGLQTKRINKWTCEKIHEFEGNYYYTENAKYRAYSLFTSDGKYRGYVVYSWDRNNKKECITYINAYNSIVDTWNGVNGVG